MSLYYYDLEKTLKKKTSFSTDFKVTSTYQTIFWLFDKKKVKCQKKKLKKKKKQIAI